MGRAARLSDRMSCCYPEENGLSHHPVYTRFSHIHSLGKYAAVATAVAAIAVSLEKDSDG